MNLNKFLAALIVFTFLVTSHVYPIGAGITGLNFLKISQGARQSGMGEAFTGLADDVNAIFWNPAGLAQLTRHQACLQHSLWMIDINFQYLAYALPVSGIGTFALYGVLLNGGEIIRTTESPTGGYVVPNENDKASAGDMLITAAYAKKISDFIGDGSIFSDIYAGISVNISSETIYTDSGGGVSANIGALYRPKYENFSLGLMVENAGVATNRPSLPLAIRAGFGFQFSLENMMSQFSDEGLFAFKDNDFSAAMDVVYYPEEGITRVHFGGEKYWQISKYHALSLRLGYKFISELGMLAGLTAGAGYRLAINNDTHIELDYSFNPYGDLGDAHRISMTGKFLGVAETRVKRDKKEAERFYKEGYALLYNKKYPEAILKFSECLKRDREYKEAYMGMGACFLRIGKKETAKKAYMIALEKDPGNVKLKEFIDSYQWEQPGTKPAPQQVK